MTTTSAAHPPPVRVVLAPDDGRSWQHLRSRLDGFERRIDVLRDRDGREPDLVLVDPCVDGTPLDLTALGQVGGDRLVVYTAAPTVDELAFAMAGSVMEGRLRGWLWQGLGSSALVDAIERIHRGDVVIETG